MARNSEISRRSLLAAFGLIPAAGLLRAQQQDPATFSTGVKVVNLFANVRNKKGEIVRDLTKDDFLLDEEGHPQTIAYFSQESDLPLTLGLMVDTSGSQRNLIDQERAASYRFFEQVLRPEKDVAFVIHFDFDTELLQDITASRRLLEQALEDLSAPSQMRRRGQGGGGYPGGGYPGGGGQGRGGMRGGGTVLYDAVLLGSDELMRKQKGRKALVILSDGVDTGSKVTLSSAVESAQRADTLVYSILFEDREAYGSPGFGGMGRGRGRGRMPMPTSAPANGKKVLERISTETGGRFFEVSRKEPLEKIYQEIEEDLRHQYSMGYTPSEHAAGYRKIHLATKQKGLTVQTRDGYYAT
ncbi:MAG TPA: VWA domain-containing protein [Candidatus Solibacter sp.]|jgi:VWFA-related protein